MKEVLKNIYELVQKGAEVKIDSRQIKAGDIFIALKGKNFDGNKFALSALELGAEAVILDNQSEFEKIKNKNLKNIFLVENSVSFLQNLAKYHRQNLNIPVLGITGSNGKTTTKELLGAVLAKKFNILMTAGNLNNHLGVPLTILKIKPEHNFAIIEMGANHCGEIKLLAEIAQPNFGLITNIGKAHLGEFGSEENIFLGKKELYDFIYKNKGKIFLNPKDEKLKRAGQKFLIEDKVFYEPGRVISTDNFLIAEIAGMSIKTNLIGEYNFFNLQAGVTVGKYFEIELEKIKEALESYQPQNNRSQFIKSTRGNNLVVDCYNANPSSMLLAIESFLKLKSDQEKIFILGEMKELGKESKKEHLAILNLLKKERVFAVGREFLNLQLDFKFKNFDFFETVEELIDFLEKEKIKNKIILIKGSNGVNLIKVVKERVV